MKSLLLAGLATGVLSLGPAATYAGHTGYEGGCGMEMVTDRSLGVPIGPRNTWRGVLYVTAVAMEFGVPADVPISVACELVINSGTPRDVLFAAGRGVVATADRGFSFLAAEDDVVTLCERVVVNGELARRCSNPSAHQFVPQPVIDAVGQTEPTACPVIALLAPTVVVGTVEITHQGDIKVSGQPWYDCPPYGEGLRTG